MNFATYLGAAKKTTANAGVKRLQAAIATLGKIAKSAKLTAIKADGLIGPKTVEAVNWAFTQHLGPGQAPAQYRTGKLPSSYIVAEANTLASYVETEIKRRGATPATPATVNKGAATKAAASTAPAAALATSGPPVSKAAALALQNALRGLGTAVGSSKLKVAADGVIGKGTATAVNWAFTNHIGSGQAPAAFRTGNLTVDQIKANVGKITDLVNAETARRGTVVAPKAATATAPAKVSTAQVKRLQSAIYSLGRVAGSAKLQIKADGVLGPKTVDAVNWAFTQHIGSGQAPAQYRTGKLSINDVKASIDTLAQLVAAEVTRRGSAVTAPAPEAKVATKTGKTVTAKKVATRTGTTYKVKDDSTGQEYYTKDPTDEPPPPAPKDLPTPRGDQEDVAADVSTTTGRTTTAEQFEPTPGTDSGTAATGGFFAEHKMAILIGAGAVALVGIAAIALKRRSGGGNYAPALAPARRRMVRA